MVYEIEHSAWKEDAKKYLIKKLKLMKLSTDKVIFSPDYPYENKSYNVSNFKNRLLSIITINYIIMGNMINKIYYCYYFAFLQFSITDSNIENIMNFKKAQIKYIVEKYKNRKSMLRQVMLNSIGLYRYLFELIECLL